MALVLVEGQDQLPALIGQSPTNSTASESTSAASPREINHREAVIVLVLVGSILLLH